MSCTTKKVQFREPIADKVCVGIHKAHSSPTIHGLELALMDRIDHFVIIESLSRRQLHVPGCFEARSHFRVIDGLVAGKKIRHVHDRWRPDVCPRSGMHRNLSSCNWPVMSSRFEMAVEASEPMLCWVIPIAIGRRHRLLRRSCAQPF